MQRENCRHRFHADMTYAWSSFSLQASKKCSICGAMIKLNGKYQFFASLYLAVWMASTFFLLPHLLGIDLRDHQVHIMIKIAYALVMALCLPVGNYLVLKFGRYHEISGKP